MKDKGEVMCPDRTGNKFNAFASSVSCSHCLLNNSVNFGFLAKLQRS